MREVFFNRFNGEQFIVVRRNAFWFTPGLFLILVGLVALLAPQLVLAVVASIFVFVGLLACFIGWKLMQFKNRIEKLAKKFDGQVVIQGINLQSDRPSEPHAEQKKIVYH